MKKLPKKLLLCSASTLALLGQALAQTPAPTERPAEDKEVNALEKVVVTGSRVIRTGDSSPSPVTVVPAEDLLTLKPGATLAEALNSLPVFSGSRGAGSNPTTVGVAAGGNGSANQLNLRNIGATRTLVLMDNKRVPPTLFNGIVDVDIIPQMFVDRVDVVTGGVSAVYGSDAITGVVNYVINRKFNGVKLMATYGVSEKGDAGKHHAGVAWGANLGGGLHAEAGFEYRKEEGIDRRSSRDWMNQWGVTGAGTTANPYVLQSDLRQKDFPFGGLITTGALAGQVFKTDGVLSTFTNGTATGTTSIQVGGDGGYWDAGLLARLEGKQLFGRLDYTLSTDTRAHFQVSGNLKTNGNVAETNQLNGITLRRTNGFLPASIQALMPGSQPTFRLSKFMAEVPRVQSESDTQQWVTTGGIEGKVGGLSWDVDFTHGNAKLDTRMANVLNRQKLAAALDAVSSNGQVVCNIKLTNPGRMDDCVPLNVFGPSAASAAAVDYVTDGIRFQSTTVMNDLGASVRGSPFSTWAGPVNAALSAGWRKMSFESGSSSRATDVVDCTGLTLNCTVGNPLTEFIFGELPQGVSQTVREFAGEVDAPLAKGVNMNAAVRDTKYNTSGKYLTWKAGVDWHVLDSLRFRATRSRDIRAPTLFDLFAPTSIVQVRPLDLLTNTTPTVPSIDESNHALKAEIGNTVTVGLVWKPAPRLSFALDAYRIRISDAITSVTGSTPGFQQACYASGGASPYCELQARPGSFTDTSAANAVTAWYVRNINVAEVETWGVDLEANYAGKLLDRPMSLRALVAWQPHVYYRQPGLVTVDQGGVGFGPGGLASTPAIRVSGFLRFKPTDSLTVDVMQRWRSAMKLSGDPTQVWVRNRMPSFATTAVTLSYEMETAWGEPQFFVNAENLFDATPPQGAFSGNGTRAGLRDGSAVGDDPRGRYFSVGMRLSF